MNFTGKNLNLIRQALELALDDIHTQKAMLDRATNAGCFEEDINDLDKQARAFKKLIYRIDNKRVTHGNVLPNL